MDKQFRTAEELADWLESLRETTPEGAITNTFWEPAQRAARAVRESGALADTQRAIIEAAERRGYVRAVREAGSAWTNC